MRFFSIKMIVEIAILFLKVKIAGLEHFAERVSSFLREAIERQYPDHHLAPDMSLAEQGYKALWSVYSIQHKTNHSVP